MMMVTAPIQQAVLFGMASAWNDALASETDPNRVTGNAIEFLGYAQVLERMIGSVPPGYQGLIDKVNGLFARAAIVRSCEELWPVMCGLIQSPNWVDGALFARIWLLTTGRGLSAALPYSDWYKTLYAKVSQLRGPARTISALHEARVFQYDRPEEIPADVWDRIDWYVYHFSPEPKGGDNWGRNNRYANRPVLYRAMAAVEAEELMKVLGPKEWLERICRDFLVGQDYDSRSPTEVAAHQLGERGKEFVDCFMRACERELGLP